MTEQLAPSKAEAELALYCACKILKEIVRTGSIVTLAGLDDIPQKTKQDRDEKTTERVSNSAVIKPQYTKEDADGTK